MVVETRIRELIDTWCSGNTGIGFTTTAQLLKHRAKVYIACRSEARATDAIARLVKENPAAEGQVVYLPFDLTDVKSAQFAAKTLETKEERLDIVSESWDPARCLICLLTDGT